MKKNLIRLVLIPIMLLPLLFINYNNGITTFAPTEEAGAEAIIEETKNADKYIIQDINTRYNITPGCFDKEYTNSDELRKFDTKPNGKPYFMVRVRWC